MNVNGKTEGTRPDLFGHLEDQKLKSFGAASEEELKTKIARTSTYDLAVLAGKFGLRVTTDRNKVEKQILSEFRQTKAAHEARHVKKEEVVTDQDKIEKRRDFMAFLRN